MEYFTYVHVAPDEEPQICCDTMSLLRRLVDDKEENLTGFEYKGAYILYDKTAAEANKPMNRFLQLEDGDITAISGDFAIVSKNPEEFGYVALSMEQQRQFFEEFKAPHVFVAAFGKLLVFEKHNMTELSLLTAIDIHESSEEEEEDGQS